MSRSWGESVDLFEKLVVWVISWEVDNMDERGFVCRTVNHGSCILNKTRDCKYLYVRRSFCKFSSSTFQSIRGTKWGQMLFLMFHFIIYSIRRERIDKKSSHVPTWMKSIIWYRFWENGVYFGLNSQKKSIHMSVLKGRKYCTIALENYFPSINNPRRNFHFSAGDCRLMAFV